MSGEERAAFSFWQVLDSVAAPIFIQDQQHRIVFANRSLYHRSQYTDSEFLAQADRIFSPDLLNSEAVFTSKDPFVQTGYLYDAAGIVQEISIVKTIAQDASGTPFIVATIKEIQSTPESTQLQQEIQERKAVEAALVRSQQRLTLLVQQSPFTVVEWTANYKIQTWNKTAERVFGYRRSEAVGRSLEEILPELVCEEAFNQIAPLLTQSGMTQQVQTHITQSGQAIICEWYHYPLLAPNGSVMSIVSMGIDVG
ncbi:MAG TPA: PAS domain-containing protein, partial [Leptolyngbya sp.]|nr:PAS domain-containing protein [Leptolyngbya sp.]